ncbi:MAG: HIT family protein [Nanoarchaeota archaeon]|nr:HIT family protein [Nanoarchaeota archaeon]
MYCEICEKRVKNREGVVIYEDDLVIAMLRPKQVTKGKTSVYYKKHAVKFSELSDEERNALMNSVVKVAKMLEKTFKPDHMNYALMGNYWPHLHWHLIPRYKDKNKDNFFFKDGLEYPILGRMIQGKFDASKEELEKLAEEIKKN